MKEIGFNYENSLISIEELKNIYGKVSEEIKSMKDALEKDYDDPRASLNLLDDTLALEGVKELVSKKKSLQPKILIVVGIGGSNLGTIAVQEAVFGKFYNLKKPDIKILYADTVDSDLINDIITISTPIFKKGGNVIINVVSKSGGTTETIANFEVLVDHLKGFKKNYEDYVVVTTDKDSKLWNLAVENNFDVLEIPKKVGGRFSVFSSVGLFPLGLIGINLDQLLAGAKTMREKCLNFEIKNNPAALSAGLIFLHHQKGIKIHDLFIFSPDLESVGKWYRQLMGESIGKEYDRDGEQVFNGITPTVSIGSVDLHSMAQLFLGGPYDKFTTFISVKNKDKINVPDYQEYSKLVDNIQGFGLQDIMTAIYNGVKISFRNGNRPFMEINLEDKSPRSIGQLLQMKMMEMMFLGYLINVNPFDQPNVELYKKETKKILGVLS